MTLVQKSNSAVGPHTNDCLVQILRLLSVWVAELIEHSVQGFWIRTIEDEVLQEPRSHSFKICFQFKSDLI